MDSIDGVVRQSWSDKQVAQGLAMDSIEDVLRQGTVSATLGLSISRLDLQHMQHGISTVYAVYAFWAQMRYLSPTINSSRVSLRKVSCDTVALLNQINLLLWWMLYKIVPGQLVFFLFTHYRYVLHVLQLKPKAQDKLCMCKYHLSLTRNNFYCMLRVTAFVRALLIPFVGWNFHIDF